MEDYSTEAGAQELANRLNAYWHSRGHITVQHWVEKTNTNRRRGRHPERDHSTHYVICSNLVNGLPP